MPVIEILGYGNVAFPDTMSNQDIEHAITNNIMPTIKATQPAASSAGVPSVAPTPSALVPPVPEKEATVLSQLVGGTKQVASDYSTLIQSLGSKENANKAALDELQHEQDIGQEIGHVKGIPEVKKAYAKEGILGAAKEIATQIPGAIASSGPQMATTIGGNVVGAALSKNPIGAYAGGFAALYPQFYMQNLAEQADQQLQKGQPVDVNRGKAATAAALQAGIEEAGTIYAYGKNFLKAVVGTIPKTEAEKALATKTLVESAKSVIKSVGVGTAKTAVEESIVNPSQTLLERWQSGQDLFSKEAMDQYGADVYGSLLQSPLGSAAGFHEVHTARNKLAEAGLDWQGNPIEGPQPQSEGQKALSDSLGQLSTKPDTTKTPQPNVVTPEQLLTHAETRLQELETKANGTPAQETVDETGNKITLPEQGAQPMTPQETAELKFLQEHKANPEKLAEGYGVTIGTPQVTGSHNTQAAIDELNGKPMPISPIYQEPKPVEPTKPAEPEVPSTPETTTQEPEQLPPTEEKFKPTLTEQNGKERGLPTLDDAIENAGDRTITPINPDKPMYARMDWDAFVQFLGQISDKSNTSADGLSGASATVHADENRMLPKTKTKDQIVVKFRPNTLGGVQWGDDPNQFRANNISRDAIDGFTIYYPNKSRKFPGVYGNQAYTAYMQNFTKGFDGQDRLVFNLRRNKNETEKGQAEQDIVKAYLRNLNERPSTLQHGEKVKSTPGLNPFQKTIEKYKTLGEALNDLIARFENAIKNDDFSSTSNIYSNPRSDVDFAMEGLNKAQVKSYLDIMKKLVKIDPVTKTHLFIDPRKIGGNGWSMPGFYQPENNLLAIMANGKIDTFIHESVHAATVHFIQMNPNHPSIKKLEKILEASRVGDRPIRDKYKIYGNTDLKEFIAEAFSNPQFIQRLMNIAPLFDKTTETSIWGNLKNTFREMLGIASKDRRAFDEVMDLSDELFTGKTLEAYKHDLGHPVETLANITMDAQKAQDEQQSRQLFNYRGEPIDIRKWEIPEQGKIAARLSKWFQEFADEHVTITKVQNAIKALGRSISDMSDTEKKLELKNSRISDQLLRFVNEEVNPIVKEMVSKGVSIEEINKYLHARHAEAYNNRMNDINHRVDAEGNIIPYALKDRASGMSTEDANNYLNNLTQEREQALKDIADKWYAIRDKTQEISVSSGDETQETIDLWKDLFPDYVPLNREQEQQAMPAGLRTGAGVDVRGNFSKRAMGSEKQVTNIVDALMYQRERSVARAENNEVGKSVYRLALENPKPDFWMAINPDAIHSREKLIQELGDMGYANAEEIADNIMAEPKERYLRKVRATDFVIDPTTGLPIPNSKEVVDARISRNARFGDNVLTLKVNGRERYVFFNQKDPNAVTMVRTLKNLDAETLGKFLSLNRFINHYFGQLYTVLNPVFGIVNGIRDYPFGMANLSTTPIRGKQAQVSAKIFPAMMGIMGVLRKERAGDGSANNRWQQIYKEATEAGFQTSNRYGILNTGEDKSHIEETLNKFKDGNSKKAFRYIIGMTYDFASMIENGVRLASYQQMREAGYTPQQSASVAKNLTINFDKKGARTGALRSLYLFFNASVRGTVRLGETLAGPSGGRIIAGGILLGVMQAMMMAAAGFKDDDPPEYIKEHNLIIPTGDGKYITLPMPYGLNILPNTGRIFTEYANDVNKHGFQKAKAGKKAMDWTNSLFSTFSPFGNQGLSMNALVPSAIEPIAAVAPGGTNKNSFGQTISRQDSYTRPTPGYMRTKESGTGWGKEFARWMNLFTQGTDTTKGAWSPTGDDIDFLAASVTGPVVGSVAKTAKYIKAKMAGEEVPAYQTPVLGRFEGEIDSKPVITSRFYNNINAMYEHELTLKNLKDDPQATQKYIQENPDARAYKRAEHVESQINNLNDRKKKFESRGAPKEALQRLDNQKIIIMNRFNDQLDRIRNQ